MISRGRMLFVFLVVVPLLAGCDHRSPAAWQGYVEGESLFISAPVGGTLQRVAVNEGERIDKGQRLFSLDPAPQSDNLAQAKAGLSRAAAQLADMEKGKRPQELAVIQAQYAETQAAEGLSSLQLQRAEALFRRKLASQSSLDEARTTDARNRHQVQALAAQLQVAKLAARPDQLEAAREQVRSAQALVDQAQWQLSQKQQDAPAAGLVQQVLYRPGEYVAPGQPVIALLPPARLKIRFFVPEPALSSLQPGARVQVSCDGCKSFEATIRYISPTAEYTPPFIYSRDNRKKFVYLVEAWPGVERAVTLHPGQPVDVRPEGRRSGMQP